MKAQQKITVLDGYALNPGDLDWNDLRLLGECAIHDRTSPEEVLGRAAGAGIILINKTILDRGIIEGLPDLKYIGVMATGYDVVDMNAANERHISVTNVPEYSTQSVAQMVFALLLELTQHVGHHAETVRNGRWTSGIDFCYWDTSLIELDRRIIGIIGYGKIGHVVARIARAFGMKVLVNDIRTAEPAEPDISFVGLDDIFSTSDVVSLHCPLTPETHEIINAGHLALMKRSAFLINTSRGPLINDNDLAEALNTEKIAGVGLDVLTVEPPGADNPLLNAKNCIITPHIAWATWAARKRLMDTVVDNVRAFLRGESRNVVNYL